MISSIVCWIFCRKSFSIDDYRFFFIVCHKRELAKPDDTPLNGKTDGLLVISFATYLQKGNMFPLYTSSINPWIMNANVHT